jgi:hypothetical protein
LHHVLFRLCRERNGLKILGMLGRLWPALIRGGERATDGHGEDEPGSVLAAPVLICAEYEALLAPSGLGWPSGLPAVH